MKLIIMLLLIFNACTYDLDSDEPEDKECTYESTELYSICRRHPDGEYYKCNIDGYYELCDSSNIDEEEYPCMYEENNGE
jgi:hypothetical protein